MSILDLFRLVINGRCPFCGKPGRFVQVTGWQKKTCTRCGQTFNYGL